MARGSVTTKPKYTDAAPFAWDEDIEVGAYKLLSLTVPAAVGAGDIALMISLDGGETYALRGTDLDNNTYPLAHDAENGECLMFLVPPGCLAMPTHTGTPGATVVTYALSA